MNHNDWVRHKAWPGECEEVRRYEEKIAFAPAHELSDDELGEAIMMETDAKSGCTERLDELRQELRKRDARTKVVGDILVRAIERAGADGLVNIELECGCSKDDLAPCQSIDLGACELARREPCTTGETDWWYVPLDRADHAKGCESFGGGIDDTLVYDVWTEDGLKDLPELPSIEDIAKQREERRGR